MPPKSLFEVWALSIAKDAQKGIINLISEEAEEYLLPVLIAMGEEEHAKFITEEVIGRKMTEDEIKKVRTSKRLREGEKTFVERMVEKLKSIFKKRWMVIRITLSNNLAKDAD